MIKRWLALFGLGLLTAVPGFASAGNDDYVLAVLCGFETDEEEIEWIASGSAVSIGEEFILTNAHVALYEDEETGDLYEYDVCVAGYAPNGYSEPEYEYIAELYGYNYDDYFDYAFMTLTDFDGETVDLGVGAPWGNADSLVHGDDLQVLGFPDNGSYTISITTGEVTGFAGTNWIITDALIDHGSSGGGAFDVNGSLIGITTSSYTGGIGQYTYLQNINAIYEDAFGDDAIVRDYDDMYSTTNEVCAFGECFNYTYDEAEDVLSEGEDSIEIELEITETDNMVDTDEISFEDEEEDEDEAEDEDEDEVEDSEERTTRVTLEEIALYDVTKKDAGLAKRMDGRVLLQVEKNGEAWYMVPGTSKRVYLADGTIAYTTMRYLGLGITNKDLALIPTAGSTQEVQIAPSVCKTNATANRLKGKILLQVEEHGEAWYVHPDTCRRIYMKDGEAAYAIMRFLSLGITNSDLLKLEPAHLWEFYD